MPPRNLDELVQRACAQILSDVELQELCSQTVEAKQVEAVLLQLLNAKTVASRTNLRNAPTLRSGHIARKMYHSSKSARIEKGRHLNKDCIASKAVNLPFVVTGHAFERFIERHLQSMTIQEGLEFLHKEALGAAMRALRRRLRSRTRFDSGNRRSFSPKARCAGPSFVGCNATQRAHELLPNQQDFNGGRTWCRRFR